MLHSHICIHLCKACSQGSPSWTTVSVRQPCTDNASLLRETVSHIRGRCFALPSIKPKAKNQLFTLGEMQRNLLCIFGINTVLTDIRQPTFTSHLSLSPHGYCCYAQQAFASASFTPACQPWIHQQFRRKIF